MFSRISLFLCSFFVFLSIISMSRASDYLNLTCKEITFYNHPLELIAKGDVIAELPQTVIYADKVVYSPDTKILTLFNYKIYDLKDETFLSGKTGVLNLRTSAFSADTVFIYFKKYDLSIKAWGFKKTPIQEYLANKALVTTCTLSCKQKLCSPPWDIYFHNFMLTGKGVTTGKLTEFRVKQVPLLFLPNLVFLPRVDVPLLPYRKAGFLFPTVIHGTTTGWGVQIPYFFPLNDQIDFTVAPFYIEKVGVLWDLESSYKLFPNSQGLFKVRYVKNSKKSDLLSKNHNWWIVGKVDLIRTKHMEAHIDFDFASNKDIIQNFDFGEGSFSKANEVFKRRFSRDIEDKSQSLRTSSFWLTFYQDSVFGDLQSRYIQTFDPSLKPKVLQPLAYFNFSLLNSKVFSWITADGGIKSWFNYRKQGYYGEKYQAFAGITVPFKLFGLWNRVSAKGVASFYHLQDFTGFKKRDILNYYGSAEVKSFLLIYRRFGTNIVHTIKPFVIFNYQTKPHTYPTPIFSEDDLFNQTQEKVSYGIWSFVSTPNYPQLITFKIAQNYQVKPKTSQPFSLILLEVGTNLGEYLQSRLDANYDVYTRSFKRQSVTVSSNKLYFDQLSIGYEYDPDSSTKQLIVGAQKTWFKKWFNRIYLSKNLTTNKLIGFEFETGWQYDCYSISFGYTENPQDKTVWFKIQLKGLGSYTFR